MRNLFYKKEKKKIVPVEDSSINSKAQKRLDTLFSLRDEYLIPIDFIENWDKVALYNPKGIVENAKAIILNPENGAYSLNNKLNALTGKEWTKFTCSWFIFNALREDLKQEKEIDPTTEQHPATYSPTMIGNFINFFTKPGDKVLDPFVGIGSTLEACKRTGRIGYGVELNKKYFELCKKRTPEFSENIFNCDSTKISEIPFPLMNFCISSPPYWNILNRSTRDFERNRISKELDVNYSDEFQDLGNIDDYDRFLSKLSEIYFDIHSLLKQNSYIVIIIKNIKKGGKLYPLAWDLAKLLSKKYTLKDEKIWIQDKISLAPYGYPYAWASNILHHYCIILRKEK
jgi:DNA modification methylase